MFKHAIEGAVRLISDRLPALGAGLALAAVPLAAPACGQESGPAVADAYDGPTFPVSAIEVRYLRENPRHPPIDALEALVFVLTPTPSGLTAPKADAPTVQLTLADIRARPVEPYHASALQRILETVRDHYVVDEDLLGVFVAPDPLDIDETGNDLRPPGDTGLGITVSTGIVTELRTIASGERVGEGWGQIRPADRIDNPVHRSIIDRSPLRPVGPDGGEAPDLIRKRELDRFLFHLDRHPGRRVDASVAAGVEVGGTALDYMVTENRPLTIYAQVSNTGTSETDYWRERFGFFHTQLTNHDDILSFDYTTANFDQVHAVSGSYEAPFPNDRIRGRISGYYADYTASDLGFFDEDFESKTWGVGGQVIANVFQDRELFIDLIGGVRYMNVEVDNEAFLIEGEEGFVIWQAGAQLEASTEWYETRAVALFEWQIGDLSGVDEDEIVALGRTDPDEDWLVLRANASHSVFLEPLLDREAWEDPSTPQSSTLAHELLFVLRGQYAFNNRLIPQEESVAGGLYTVRGYPESAVAGDSSIIGTIEYRYHVPRGLDIQPEPRRVFGQPFRVAPQYVYGSPDWDLVLKAFLDVGRVVNSERFSFEENEWLVGTGIGAEFLFRRNLSVRVDWGFALDTLDSPGVNYGANRVHIVATILF